MKDKADTSHFSERKSHSALETHWVLMSDYFYPRWLPLKEMGNTVGTFINSERRKENDKQVNTTNTGS